jgi:MoxR-like ATPase
MEHSESSLEETPSSSTSIDISAGVSVISQIKTALKNIFVGQDELVDGVLTAVIANGHVMVESLPGLGKTLLVKALARLLGLENNRIQFTPDLMPSDITGSHVFDLAERRFVFHHGPVFTSFLLADELNRSPAKTHAALLEVMAEHQVTVDGTRYPVAKPFLVMATQNPIENEGTYTLPEAQLDRFIFKLAMTYPDQGEEENILRLHMHGNSPMEQIESLNAVTDAAGVCTLQTLASQLTVDDSIIAYITTIVRRSRSFPGLYLGASPRAGLAMLTTARATALLRGRDFVIPDDVVDVALPALRHRVLLAPEAEVEGRHADDLIKEIIQAVEVPRGAKVAAAQ